MGFPTRRASCRLGQNTDRGWYGKSTIWAVAGRRPSSSAIGCTSPATWATTCVIYAFDLNGKPQWRSKNGESWTGSYPGARACCVYSEGKLYHINAHGRVACLSAATGKELWACDVQQRFHASEPTWAFSECLLVDGPRLIVTPGSGKALMAALDKQNGRTLWTTGPLGEDRATYSAPILFRYGGRRTVANCSSAHGFGVDADTGKLLWTVPLRNSFGVNVTIARLRRWQRLLRDVLLRRSLLPLAVG